MNCRLFKSKLLTISTLCLFVFLLTPEVSSYSNYMNEENFAKLIKEGEALYQNKEFDKAIIRYMEAYMEAEREAEFSDVYLRLALAYSATNQKSKAKEFLLKLLKIQPDKTIEEQSFPADFVILFYQAKIDVLKPAVESPEPEMEKSKPAETEETKKEEPTKEVAEKQKPAPVKEEKKPTQVASPKKTKPETTPKKEVAKTAAKEPPAKEVEKQPVTKTEKKEPLPEKLKKVPGVKDTEEKIEEPEKGVEPKEAIVKEAEEKPVVKSLAAEEATAEKGKKVPWLLIGGLVVIGGALAYLFLGGKSNDEESTAATAGSIQVNSSPSGAKVFLDGSDTNEVTNTTLTGISAGSHEVRIFKEGYVDHEESVMVTGGETAIVNANLSKHTITVNTPTAGVALVKGKSVQITWTTGGGAIASGADKSHFSQLLADGSGSRAYLRLKVYRERETMRSSSHSPNAKRGNDGDDLSRVRKVIGELSPSAKGDTAMKSQGMGARASTPGANPGSLNLDPHTQSGVGAASPGDIAYVQAISDVIIDLYQNDEKVSTINNRTPNDGLFNWKIPQNVNDGFQYKIRVAAADEPSVFGMSKAFSIKTDYEFETQWGSKGTRDGELNQPVGVAFKLSKLFVVENINSRISIFTQQGTFLGKYGSPGDAQDQFNNPIGVAVDNSGNVYIADTGNERIMKFTSNGVFVRNWGRRGGNNGEFRSPSGIAVDNQGNVYVADSYNFRIQKFNSDGKFLMKWGSRGDGDNQFGLPTGVAVDDGGNVYVADTENHRLMKFNSNGEFLLKWGSHGSGDDKFNQPSGVAVDSAGDVFVSDSENHRVMKFNSSGALVFKLGSRGDGNQQFRYPAGIAVDSQGNIYVADSGNYRIMKFALVK
ncbi:MAG: SMP-30/gluconolactonase/LRE family protein [Candidatus Aminicenantes bacterium]|nr:SMP-30/gluconolactonase/LRE family protein [Candidatus Aminicenantes bacterium]